MKNSLGPNLKFIRDKNGISQKELANLAGVSVQTLCEIENGHRVGSLDSLLRIAEALDCSLDSLVFGEDGRAGLVTNKSDEERALRSIAELIKLNYVYVHGEKGISGSWDDDVTLDFMPGVQKGILLDFADSLLKLKGVRSNFETVDKEFDSMVNEAIKSTVKKMKGGNK